MRFVNISKFETNTAILLGVNPNSSSLYMMADNAPKSISMATKVINNKMISLKRCFSDLEVSETEKMMRNMTPRSIILKIIRKSRS